MTMRWFLFVYLLGWICLSHSENALAANRKVHFSSFANVETPGVDTSIAAECVLIITNAGPTAQIFGVEATNIKSSTNNGTYNNATAYSSVSLTGCALSLNMINCTLAAGDTTTITYRYESMAANNPGTQVLNCAGAIQVRDAADNAPGFIVANGSLMTYMPTSAQKVGAYKCTPTCGWVLYDVKQNVAFSQLQILIGEGRPF